MSYKNFEKALEKAKGCKDYEIKGETSIEVVKKAEKLFGYKLSRQNYEYYKKLGHMDLYGAEFYGIVKDDFSGAYTGCAIEATLQDRIDYNLPSEWLTIYDFDDGYMGYLDYSQLNENGEPPVICAIYNGKEYVVSEKLAEDFGDFLLNFVEEHLANQEDNNQEGLPENNQGNQISSHEDSEEHLENQKLKLTMDLLPQGAWDKNLSKTLPQKEWDSIRHAAYERAEYKCEICGAKDGQLEAHEVWEFNVDQKSQKLIDITAICKNCHLVKHFRHTKMIGGEEYAKKHFMQINQCDEQTFIEHYREAESRFDELSKIESWTVDTSAINELS